jgi:hypothetical protein
MRLFNGIVSTRRGNWRKPRCIGPPKGVGCPMKYANWLEKEPISGFDWDRVKRCRALRDQLAVNLDITVLFMSTKYEKRETRNNITTELVLGNKPR